MTTIDFTVHGEHDTYRFRSVSEHHNNTLLKGVLRLFLKYKDVLETDMSAMDKAQYIHSTLDDMRDMYPYFLAVTNGEDRLVGAVICDNWVKDYKEDKWHSCELHVVCEREFYGFKCNEASRIFMSFLFSHVGLHKLTGTIPSYNTKAIRNIKRLGFTQSGVLREDIRKKGKLYDNITFDILRHEHLREEGKNGQE